MGRALLVLHGEREKAQARHWINKAPWGTRVTFQGPKRTLPQNDAFWAAMTDISQQKTHHGLKLSPEDWRILFISALGQEMRMVPNLEGTGFVALGRSSSKLSVEEMSALLDLIHAWCAREGVILNDPARNDQGPEASDMGS